MIRAQRRSGTGERMGKRKTETSDTDTMTKAEEISGWRKLNSFIGYWRLCGSNACKRARGCASNDPQACFLRLWPMTPERIRFEIRGYITGLNAGLSPEEAIRKAAADTVQWADQIAAVEAEQFAAAEVTTLHASSCPAIARPRRASTP
jgi:hypothetical protein